MARYNYPPPPSRWGEVLALAVVLGCVLLIAHWLRS